MLVAAPGIEKKYKRVAGLQATSEWRIYKLTWLGNSWGRMTTRDLDIEDLY
jgi:hypothetical protein